METNEFSEPSNPRAEWIKELRKKYLDGSLEHILIPENPKLDRLMEDLFPEEDEPHTPGQSSNRQEPGKHQK